MKTKNKPVGPKIVGMLCAVFMTATLWSHQCFSEAQTTPAKCVFKCNEDCVDNCVAEGCSVKECANQCRTCPGQSPK